MTFLPFNYFAISSLVNAFTSFSLFLFLFYRSPKTKTNLVFGLFTFVVGFWGFGHFLAFSVVDKNSALFFHRMLMMGAIFIPSTYLHFVCLFLNIENKKIKVINFFYLASIFFALSNLTPFFITGVKHKLIFDFFETPGFLYHPFLLMFAGLSIYSHFLMFKYLRIESGLKVNQIKYIFVGTLVGFIGGSTNFFLVYDIPILPFGNCLVSVYILTVAIAILKYRLLDIKLVITRATIFLVVYSLILGIPIWFGFKLLGDGLWVLPMSLMGIFATIGPFIYFYIQKKAEDQILQEQRAYQATLRQASAGMGRIKDLDKLLNMIVHVLTKTVRIEHSVIYIYDEINKVYRIGSSKHRSSSIVFRQSIPCDHPLISYLNSYHISIVYEETKQKIQDSNDEKLISIEVLMHEIEAALIVPIYINNELIAFVAMGKKENGKLYNEEDLVVFSILANQVSLAIENAQFYDDMKVTQEQLFQAEKMATIGIMADGLSHQINNRFHAMGFIAGDALDTIKMSKNLEMTDKLKEVISELERALVRVQENVTQGGEVVQGLLKYTRKGEEGFSPVALDAVISSAYEMAQFKIKSYQMSLIRAYDKETLPKVKGNSTQLQEVFFNLIDNAYDAMMQRKNELKEPEYHPTLTIRPEIDGRYLKMIFEDNGTGVKQEDMQKLFTPFFTTKLSSKKGTGLGLYVIRKIIEDNHRGKVEVVSKYMQGTQMIIRLPIADV